MGTQDSPPIDSPTIVAPQAMVDAEGICGERPPGKPGSIDPAPEEGDTGDERGEAEDAEQD